MFVRCLVLISGTSLTFLATQGVASDQHGEEVAGPKKRLVTIADSIEATRFGDPSYTAGVSAKGILAKFSPNGKRFVVVLKKGNLQANTNEYSLLLFQTAEVFQSPQPQVLMSLASSSNQPAISNVLWLDDNDTVLFLGERADERTQLYSLKCSSRQLTKLTSHNTNLTSFVAAASGEVIAYTAKKPASAVITEGVAKRGIAVTSELLPDLLKGSYGGKEFDDESLFIKRLGREGESKIATKGRIDAFRHEMSLSPDGQYLLIQTEAAHISDTWSEYEDRLLKLNTGRSARKGGHTSIFEYELVDTTTGVSQLLADAPIGGYGSEIAWPADSRSVVVSNLFFPLDVDDPAERALRRAHPFLVEFNLPGLEFVKISHEDLRLLSWDSKTGYVACDVGRIDSLSGKTAPKAYFQKRGANWSKVDPPEQSKVQPLPDIVLHEDMNTPPRIVAIDPPTDRRSLLMDLNPQFQNLALARVEEITWTDARGHKVKGGLYWPPGYVAGKKYPLIIQTHGWKADRFWMDGPWTTAFAAQALASKGFFVIQVPDPDGHIWVTPKEAPSAMAAYEGAIDFLDRRGLVDKNRVGITGFSRTYWYVTYTLTHSKYHFAAADIADGVDYSYFQYAVFSNVFAHLANENEQVYGGPPIGKNLSTWLKQSPAFLMEKIETPLRIQTLGPVSLMSDWHWYTGLSRLGKPVEMIYIPEGTHILEKPWDRMVSQQGNVDWFCFWLKGEEDSDPAKAEQYNRWRELRGLYGRTTPAAPTENRR